MALSPGLRLKQTQRLALTPGLRQSIAILKMSSDELDAHIKTALTDNPILRSKPAKRGGSGGAAYDYALDTVAQPITIGAKLAQQINHISAVQSTTNIALYLSGNLTDFGFLEDPIEDTALTLDVPLKMAKAGLALLQRCEPVGIGAKNLKDCIRLQLLAQGLTAKCITVILNNLGLIENRNFVLLSRRTGLSAGRLQTILSQLNPKPAHVLQPAEIQALVPEITVTAYASGTVVELNNSTAPALFVDLELAEQLGRKDDATKDFLKHRISLAHQLIRAVEDRSKTLLRLAKAIVQHQHLFFLHGPEHLIPLCLADLSESMKLHPSTLSRAMAGKSLSCKMGVFPLKFFMAKAGKSRDANKRVTALFVQQKIKQLVDAESPEKPLSDEVIAAMLQDNGVDIARRTVAKYRQCLKIPTSRFRRRSKAIL